MALNKPNRLVLDAFSDPQIANKPSYSGFTNTFPSTIHGAKKLNVVSAGLVNTTLQLNDDSQLFFWYYWGTSVVDLTNRSFLRCVRLHQSTYVPNAGYTTFVRNKYFNSVEELVSALNLASAVGGDLITYNPFYVPNGVIFSYDSALRQISVASGVATYYIAPAAYDDPNIAIALSLAPITQYGYNARIVKQPSVANVSLNQRIGFGQGFNAKGVWFDTTNGLVGCATPTGVPQLFGTSILPTSSPILLGSQFVGVYLDIIPNGGYEPQRRNLLANVPIDRASLNVISYIPANSIPIDNLPETISSISVLLIDENGVPYTQPPSYNVRVELSVSY